MSTDQILLYSMAVCPFAQRTEIVLRHKELAYRAISVDISKPRPPELLAINPIGKVPVLIHRDRALNESSVINEYLEDCFPQPTLFPADPWEKAQTRLLIEFCNNRFVPNQYKLLMEQNAERRPKAEKAVQDDWAWLNAFLMRLNPEGELLWKNFSMADATFAPFFQRFALNEYFWGFAIPDADSYARVRRWRTALAAHPLVRATSLPEEEYIKLYEDYALGYSNGAVPQGRERSSFDMSVPLAQRPLPPRRSVGLNT